MPVYTGAVTVESTLQRPRDFSWRTRTHYRQGAIRSPWQRNNLHADRKPDAGSTGKLRTEHSTARQGANDD